MKKLYLHIGSYKTGTTSIQNTLHKNPVELKNQGYVYPGNELNHHKFFFTTKSQEKHWPRQFKSIDKQTLKNNINEYFNVLEEEIRNYHQQQIISTEYLFIENKKYITNVADYLKRIFAEVVIVVFVRDPIDYYRSFQQQMIKGRSYIASPENFQYKFRNVIEAWSTFFNVHVAEFNSDIDSSEVFCNKVGIDYNRLNKSKKSNISLSIEQMALLEKIQRNLYQDYENRLKLHLNAILQINAAFTSKPKLQEWVKPVIHKNHREDLEWLKDKYGIDFLKDYPQNSPSSIPTFGNGRITVRDVCQVEDEQTIERYEALVTDTLLKTLIKNNNSTK